MATLTEAMNAANITTEIKRTDTPVKADKWARSAFHYRVTFTINGILGPRDANTRTMVLPYATGNGWTREPSAAEVMRCVLSDTMSVHPDYGSYRFEEWAGDLGYDPDSREAERTFKATQDQAYELETLLTRPVLESWLADRQLQESEDTDAPTGRAIRKVRDAIGRYNK